MSESENAVEKSENMNRVASEPPPYVSTGTLVSKHWKKFLVGGLLSQFAACIFLFGIFCLIALCEFQINQSSMTPESEDGPLILFSEIALNGLNFSFSDAGIPRSILVYFGIVSVLILGFGFFLATLIRLGIFQIVCKETAGKTAKFGDLFPVKRFSRKFIALTAWTVFSRIGGIAVVVGAMFLSVLGGFENDFLLAGISGILLAGAAYCAVRLFFAENIIFETDCGFFPALVESWRLTRKRDWKTRVLIFLCPIGLYFLEGDMWFWGFLATPVLVICFSVFYLKLRKTAQSPFPPQTLI